MLGKLLKYEFKASGRILLPIYLAVFIMGILSSLFMKVPAGGLENLNVLRFLSVLFMVLYIVLIMVAVILSCFIAILRFKKNLFDCEGYLMNTLPVKSSENIVSKLIVAVVYQILGMVVAMISGILSYLIYFGTKGIDFKQIINSFKMVFQELQGLTWVYSVEVVVLGILCFIAVNLMIYAAISIGHSANARKVLKSVGAYIGLYFISQIINYTLVKIFFAIFKNMLHDLESSNLIAIPYLTGIIILEALYCVGYFVLTDYFLKKKLNLQ
ncbi:MAG: hypothetical protein Q8882_02940 [Bacillota bacterium]|nr:hypothetical protein [Bacillota bacterium]